MKIIVVDPIGHETATSADIHLKLLPVTPMPARLRLAQRDAGERIDRPVFIDAHVQGAEELEAVIDSMPPEKAAQLCGVPAETIEAAAIAYAAGPSLLWLGQGVQRQRQGGNVFRALAALVAGLAISANRAPASLI